MCLAIFSFNASANLISTNWQTEGDNLITYDDVTGFSWLDLTVTKGMSYHEVTVQLGLGGQFAGFRYATNSEVIELWENFNIQLASGNTILSTITDLNIQTATQLLGDTGAPSLTYLTASHGLTTDTATPGTHSVLGAGLFEEGVASSYKSQYKIDGYEYFNSNTTNLSVGSYLIATDVTSVPLPATVLLFGSGLIVLIGFSRRKV